MGDPIRLQKLLAQAGFGSRRSCESFITEGRVTVDGAVVRQLGSKADPETQTVELDGQKVAGPGRKGKGVQQAGDKVYYMLNKPRGVLCTNEDPSGRPLAIQLVPEKRRIFCVGRLDKDTEGLLLLTNDGDLTNRLTHPRYGVDKTYMARVDGTISVAQIKKLERGVHLAEGRTQGARVRVRKRGDRSSVIELTIAEGMNRQVRRMLARVNLYCRLLKRVSIGPLRLGDLQPGESRKLTSEELKALLKAIDRAQTEAEARRAERANAREMEPEEAIDDEEEEHAQDEEKKDWKTRRHEERLKRAPEADEEDSEEEVSVGDADAEEDEVEDELEQTAAAVADADDDDDEEDDVDDTLIETPPAVTADKTRDRGGDEEEVSDEELEGLGELGIEDETEAEDKQEEETEAEDEAEAAAATAEADADEDSGDQDEEQDEDPGAKKRRPKGVGAEAIEVTAFGGDDEDAGEEDLADEEGDAENPLAERPWIKKSQDQRRERESRGPREQGKRPDRPFHQRKGGGRPFDRRNQRDERGGERRYQKHDSRDREHARSDRGAQGRWRDRGDESNPGAGVKWSERSDRRERARNRRPFDERQRDDRGPRPEGGYKGGGYRSDRRDDRRPYGERREGQGQGGYQNRERRPYRRDEESGGGRPFGNRPNRGDRPNQGERPERRPYKGAGAGYGSGGYKGGGERGYQQRENRYGGQGRPQRRDDRGDRGGPRERPWEKREGRGQGGGGRPWERRERSGDRPDQRPREGGGGGGGGYYGKFKKGKPRDTDEA